MPTDPLEGWWQHRVTLERTEGTGAYGTVYADPVNLLGFVADKTRMVRDGQGAEVVSSTTVALPAGVGFIPPGSRVTLPQQFGGRTVTVIHCAIGDAGTQPTPNHVEIALE